jgi:hypothetical protein
MLYEKNCRSLTLKNLIKKACRHFLAGKLFWADALTFALISEVGFNTTIPFWRFANFYLFYQRLLKMNIRPHTTHRRQA